jgi:hypothetical protein
MGKWSVVRSTTAGGDSAFKSFDADMQRQVRRSARNRETLLMLVGIMVIQLIGIATETCKR